MKKKICAFTFLGGLLLGMVAIVILVILYKGFHETQYVTFTIDGFPVTIDAYNNEIKYEAEQLTTERPIHIEAGEFKGWNITINDMPIEPHESVDIQLERLHGYDNINIMATSKKSGAVHTNYIRTLPAFFIDGIAISNHPDPGYYYFNLNNYIFKMDTEGQLTYYKKISGADGLSGGFDFKRTDVDGKTYYSYFIANTPPHRAALSGVGYGRMSVVVMDENYNVIDQVMYLNPDRGIPQESPLENHQFTILGDKHYLISGYVGKRVTNIPQDVPHSSLGARVSASVIQEIKDGKLVWQWDSTEHPELYGMSVDANDFYNKTMQWADYAHFNAIVIDPKDNNFICSFRNLNAILKLDRNTGDIIWILGGKGDQFGLAEDQKFSRQHDVRVTKDGGITIFNNGDEDIEPMKNGSTSIMKFKLDEKNMKATSIEEYRVENSYSWAMGSAQEVESGHYVIGWGTRVTQLPLFSEINFKTGEVLFEFVWPNRNFSDANYRTQKNEQ